jgi:hypothetical protein
MLQLLRTVVGALSTVSVFVSLVTYYLAANKQWQVKHERPVAASISITSNGLYLLTTTFFALNMLLTSAPWQTLAETALSLLNTVFILAIGLSFWVPRERGKGLWTRIVESLRSERAHLGALARALTHPSGSQAIIDVLTQVAVVDDVVDEREKAFIEVFARSWAIRVDWGCVAGHGALSTKEKYAHLRRTIDAYLDGAPPKEQALQLADIVTRLIAADEKITEAESLIGAEISALLEHYGEEGHRVVYEVHLVPQSQAQLEAMVAAYPRMPRRVLASGGAVGVAATCYSAEYAEVVRGHYAGTSFYTAVKRVDYGDALPPPRSMYSS